MPGWQFDQSVFGASLVSIAPGINGAKNHGLVGIPSDEGRKALIESVILAGLGVHFTKSWWPAVIPAAYLVYEAVWYNSRAVIAGPQPDTGKDTPDNG